MKLKQLYDRKAVVYDKMKALTARASAEKRQLLTDKEAREFAKLEKEFTRLDYDIERMEAAEQLPGEPISDGFSKKDRRSIVADAFRQNLKDCVSGKQRGFANEQVRATISAVTTGTSFGGHAVPENVLNQIFFEAVANNAFLGALSVLDISGAGTTKVPKLERGNGPSVEGRADENTQLVGSTLQFTADPFNPVDMFVLTRFSNNLIRDGIPATAGAILRACQQELTQHLAKCVLSGDGANNGEFDGLDNITGVQDIDAGGALTSWDPIIDAYEDLLIKNVDKASVKAVMSPKVWAQIAKFAATDGQPINMPKELEGLEMIVSSAVLNNYGTGTDESRIYIGDWSQMYLGMSGDYTMTLTERYADYDQSAFLLLNRADMKIFDVEAMAMVTGITTT